MDGKLVVGLDLSLNATGWCCKSGPNQVWGTFKPATTNVVARLALYQTWFLEHEVVFGGDEARKMWLQDADLIVVEDYAYSPSSRAMTGLAEQRGVLYSVLLRSCYERLLSGNMLVFVAPGTLKKFGTGAGNTTKDLVLDRVSRKYGLKFDSTDECEAFILATMGDVVLNGALESLSKYEREAVLVPEGFRAILGVNKSGR